MVINVLKDMDVKDKVRKKIRALVLAMDQIKVEDEDKTEAKQETKKKTQKKEAIQIPINRVEIMKRIHLSLTKYNASSTDRTKIKG